MAILVTGGEGYIGSHCVIALLDAGYDVVVFDNESTGFASTGEALRKIVSKGKVTDIVKGDLLNLEDLKSLFDTHDIDAAIHFAAFSQVAESMKDPAKYYRNNVTGTMNLLDAMREHDVMKIVFSSTAAVYGEPDYIPIDENHPTRPVNPYGKTKLDIEHMMDDYDRAYDLKSVRLRYFNVVGADSKGRVGECHDPETHLIPNILKSTFVNGQAFHMFGTDYSTRDGTCVRDYVNVEDLAYAHVLALRYLEQGGHTDYFNIGLGEEHTILEIVATCEKVTKIKIPIITEKKRNGDPAILLANNSKIHKILGWETKKTLEDSIMSAYNWELIKNRKSYMEHDNYEG